ncbi:polysaccharide deacetylase [Sphingomonas pituitosa]|uniref:polysaccharide deacetylase n=1 Tax=Sphingomonas pituitosa TaxID=99597 RepID=UPI00082A6BB0|nr:polysaccharide deacetylase [Sphingomonas pituitosa]
MPTTVFLTIDTELMWRHHVAGLDLAEVAARSFEPAGVGVSWQLERLAAFDLKACFFVDPMPALVHGLGPIEAVVRAIRTAGQEVQLHLHPNWTGASAADRARMPSRFDLVDYSAEEQRALIRQARALLIEAGAPPPIAFRGGSYAANDATLASLAAEGFAYDSSHNGSEHPWPSAIGLPPRRISPVRHQGVIEVPVTLIDTGTALRHFQICALSVREMRAALDHAVAQGHAALTIISHGFELANRAGTRPNAVHVRRFEALCRMLAERRDVLPTAHFADRPPLALDRDDAPLGPNALRTRLRQAEQLWSNLIEERAG